MSEPTASDGNNTGDSDAKPNKQLPSLLIRTLTNPVLLGVLGIIGFVLTIYNPFTSKEAKPVYKLLSDVVVTERGSTSKIKVYYDTVEVENVRAVTIALWNAGSLFLDKTAFSKDQPIGLYCSKPISILELNIVKTSRSDLTFDPTIHLRTSGGTPTDSTKDINQYDYVSFAIRGDEGLEAKDGVIVTILYTTNAKDYQWFASARIKGIPDGFHPASDIANIPEFFLHMFVLVFIFVTFYFLVYPTFPKRQKRFVLIVLVASIGYALYYLYGELPLLLNAEALPNTFFE